MEKLMEVELVEQRNLLADQGHQLVEIKKQVEKLLRASEQMAGRLAVLERVGGLGENNVPMIADVKEAEENVQEKESEKAVPGSQEEEEKEVAAAPVE